MVLDPEGMMVVVVMLRDDSRVESRVEMAVSCSSTWFSTESLTLVPMDESYVMTKCRLDKTE